MNGRNWADPAGRPILPASPVTDGSKTLTAWKFAPILLTERTAVYPTKALC